MSADFSPNMGSYKNINNFKFWCQKVLPLVYDDSLSYYELLCKVVNYLNDVIENARVEEENIANLLIAYNELEGYVNNYFDSIDWQEKVNERLDTYAQDGTLSGLIQPLFDMYKGQVDNKLVGQDSKIDTLVRRMDTFASLTEGSTTGDAELIDIRVPANGFNGGQPYPTAGDSVRGQVTQLSESINEIDSLYDGNYVYTKGKKSGYYDGSAITGTSSLVYTYLYFKKPHKFTAIKWQTKTNVLPVLYTITDGIQRSYGGSVGSYNVNLSDVDEFYINFFGLQYVEKFEVETLMCISKDFINRTNENYNTVNAVNCIGYEIGNDIVGTRYDGKYIGTDYKIKSPSDTNWYVYKYQVTKDNHYKLYGSGKTYNGDLPLAMRGGYDIEGMSISAGNPIIEGGNTGAIRYYEIDYYADKDGYIYIAGYGSETDFGRIKLANTVDRVSGMTNIKIQAFGDSITDDTWGSAKSSWAKILHNYMPIDITMVNSGVAGSTIAHCYSTDGRYSEKTQGNGIVDLVNDGTLETDSDVIVIFGGTNDWSGTTHLGEWTDSNNNYTISALKNIIEKISSTTNAKILVCTPLPRNNAQDQIRSKDSKGIPLNGDNKTLRDYCNAIIDVCNFYHIPTLDLNYEIGWNDFNISNYSVDRLHPTPYGAKQVAMLIASKIKSIYGI